MPSPTQKERWIMERWGMEIGPSSVSDGERILKEIDTVYYTPPPGWTVTEEKWDAGKVFLIKDQLGNVRVSWRDKWEGASDEIFVTLFEKEKEKKEKNYGSFSSEERTKKGIVYEKKIKMLSQEWTVVEELVTCVLLAQFDNLSVCHIRRVRELMRQSQVSKLWNFVVHQKVIGSIEEIHPGLIPQIPKEGLKKLTGLTKLDEQISFSSVYTNLLDLTIDEDLPQVSCPDRVKTLRLLFRKTYPAVDITPFVNITTLELSSVVDPFLSKSLIKLTNLRNLQLRSNVTINASDITPLNIQTLQLSGTCLLTKELPKLTQLTSLSLYPKTAQIVDGLIAGLTRLQILDLANVKIMSEKCILGMTQLRHLSLGRLTVTEEVFNRALRKLSFLEELHFTNRTICNYEIQPEVIRNMTGLRTLALGGTPIRHGLMDSLPESLTFLDISGNHMGGILYHLTNLVTLVHPVCFSTELLAALPSLKHLTTQRDITLELDQRPLTNLQSLTYFCLEEPSLQVMTKLVSLRNLHVKTSFEISSETDAAFHKHGINLHYRSS